MCLLPRLRRWQIERGGDGQTLKRMHVTFDSDNGDDNDDGRNHRRWFDKQKRRWRKWRGWREREWWRRAASQEEEEEETANDWLFVRNLVFSISESDVEKKTQNNWGLAQWQSVQNGVSECSGCWELKSVKQSSQHPNNRQTLFVQQINKNVLKMKTKKQKPKKKSWDGVLLSDLCFVEWLVFCWVTCVLLSDLCFVEWLVFCWVTCVLLSDLCFVEWLVFCWVTCVLLSDLCFVEWLVFCWVTCVLLSDLCLLAFLNLLFFCFWKWTDQAMILWKFATKIVATSWRFWWHQSLCCGHYFVSNRQSFLSKFLLPFCVCCCWLDLVLLKLIKKKKKGFDVNLFVSAKVFPAFGLFLDVCFEVLEKQNMIVVVFVVYLFLFELFEAKPIKPRDRRAFLLYLLVHQPLNIFPVLTFLLLNNKKNPNRILTTPTN